MNKVIEKREKLKENSEKYKICPSNFKGITLVALVITIIVLIILAGVSINAVMNGGLITNAKDASEEYDEAKTKEERDIGKMLDKIENAKGKWKQEGTVITNVEDKTIKLNVGDYVAYNPQTEKTTYQISSKYSGSTDDVICNQDTLNWRVLGVNEYGRLELISDSTTNQSIGFQGVQGYNNGVYLINDMCNTLYGNTENRSTARGLAIEDIQDALNLSVWDYKTYTAEVVYGSSKEYINDDLSNNPDALQYPTILELEKKQKVKKIGESEYIEGKNYSQSEQDNLIEQTDINTAKGIQLTQTYWNTNLQTDGSNFKNAKYYELFINDGSMLYWLSSRYVNTLSSDYNFGIYSVFFDSLLEINLCNSSDSNSYSGSNGVRPVVTLGSDVLIDTTDSTKTGESADLAWQLK